MSGINNSHTEDVSSSLLIDSIYSSEISSSEIQRDSNNNNSNGIDVNNYNRAYTKTTDASLHAVPSHTQSLAKTLTKTLTDIWPAELSRKLHVGRSLG